MNIEMINAAAGRLAGKARMTPLLSSPLLNEKTGRRIWIKPECLQHTGSFKYRGALSAISALTQAQRDKGVIAYSSGNHAQGIALAAQEFGTTAVIIMPADAPKTKIDNTKMMGAEVVLYDRVSGEDRDAIGKKLSSDRGLTLIKPFDNAEVIAGQGTAGLEIAQQARQAGIENAEVIVCCGGGGFTSGIALALEDRAPDFLVRPAEPEHFDDMARSLKAGQRLSNAKTTGSVCDAIISPTPGEITFPILQRLVGPGLVVSDEEALRAVAFVFHYFRLVAEPGGAVALAAALFRASDIESDDIIATISGGNVDADVFQMALSTYGESV